MDEQTDLVEFRMMHVTTRRFYVDTTKKKLPRQTSCSSSGTQVALAAPLETVYTLNFGLM